MKKFLAIAVSLQMVLGAAAERFVAVDADDLTPVAGATVFSASGFILGMTDDNGVFTKAKTSDYPLAVRALGFEPMECVLGTDTLWFASAAYELPEFEVVPAERPVTRVYAYVREYSTGATDNDTVRMYSEYMVDMFVADGKVKGYKDSDSMPRALTANRYARYTDSDGKDSVGNAMSADADDLVVDLYYIMAKVPTETVKETDAIRNGASADSIFGKYSLGRIYTKSDNLFSVCTDVLSNHKGHKWSPWFLKLLGLTMELDDLRMSWAFVPNDKGFYGVHDFLYGVYTAHVLCKGKWFKKYFKTKNPVEMDSYVELYPVSVTHHTVEEYKELRAENPEPSFERPAIVPPLHPAYSSIVERVEASASACDKAE